MLKQVIDVHELLDDARVGGEAVRAYLEGLGLSGIEVRRIEGRKGATDFIKALKDTNLFLDVQLAGSTQASTEGTNARNGQSLVDFELNIKRPVQKEGSKP